MQRFIIITDENPKFKASGRKINRETVAEILGHEKFTIEDCTGYWKSEPENSKMIFGDKITIRDIIKLAKEFGQEAALYVEADLNTMKFRSAMLFEFTGSGKMYPASSMITGNEARAQDGYTEYQNKAFSFVFTEKYRRMFLGPVREKQA